MDIKKLILGNLIFLFVIINLVSSAIFIVNPDDGYYIISQLQEVYKKNQNLTIDFFVYNESNGGLIDNSSTNCTVFLANNKGELIVNGLASYTPEGYWKFFISKGNLTKTGTYNLGISCVSPTQGGAFTKSLEITPSGINLTTPKAIIYILFMIAIIFTLSLTLIGAIKIPWKHYRNPEGVIIGINELKYLKLFFMVVSYLLFMFLFGLTKSILENFLYLEGIAKVFNWLYWMMFSFLWPIIVVSLLLTVVTFLSNLKLKKLLERGGRLR